MYTTSRVHAIADSEIVYARMRCVIDRGTVPYLVVARLWTWMRGSVDGPI